MKRLGMCLLFIMMTLNLTACDPTYFWFDYDELKETVIGVELIYYDNPNAIILGAYERDNLVSFDFGKMEIIETLESNKLDDFLEELSKETFIVGESHLDSPQGISIRILYNNGDFEVISYSDSFLHSYSGSFSADGKVKRFIGSGLFYTELINKYFNTQIE